MSNAHHKVSNLGVGHGLSKRNATDPHGGPMPGDASFRLYFVSAEAYQAAMREAAQLEAKGLVRRAWRVRLNLDGPQPVYLPTMRIEEYTEEKVEEEGAELADVTEEYLRGLIDGLGMSYYAIAKLMEVGRNSLKRWVESGQISVANLEKLKMVKGEK
jgi:hypothetical protein